jgi:cytochrome c oxidase cbb3-type subunit 4
MEVINDLRGITTIMALIAFLAVCFWAYSKRQKQSFSEAANSLFSEEEELLNQRSLEEMKK